MYLYSALQAGPGGQGQMEKTSCKIICGAPTTLAVKGLMIMMMMICPWMWRWLTKKTNAVACSVQTLSQIAHHHQCQSLNCEGRWGTTDDFATSFIHFSLFSTALWDLPSSRPIHSLMLSSHLFLRPPCLLPPFTVPCKMVLARPDERET